MARTTRLNPRTTAADIALGTKRALYAICNTTASRTDIAEQCSGTEVLLPVTTSRWRLRVQNWNASTGAKLSGALSCTATYVGRQAIDQYGYTTGNHVAAPAQALPAFTTPADGSAYTSAWVTDPTLQFTAHTAHLLGFGWSAAAGTPIAFAYQAGQWLKNGSGAAANAGAQTPGTSRTTVVNSAFLDIAIEYEFVGSQPVILAVGDSRTAGYTGPSSSSQCSTSRSWPHQYAMLSGCPVINLGHSGITSSAYSTPATTPALTKWGVGSSVIPDAAIVDLGTNDVGGVQSTYTVQQNVTKLYEWLRGLGCRRILGHTLAPFGNYTGYTSSASGVKVTTLTSDAASGATSVSTAARFNANEWINIDNETRQVASGGSTGSSAPYTTPLTAALSSAHPSASAVIMSTAEYWRRQFNIWMRTVPANLAGVVDLDRIMASATAQEVLDAFVDCGDRLHFSQEGINRVARSIPSRLVQPTS